MSREYTLDEWRLAEQVISETQDEIRREAINLNREEALFIGDQKRLGMLVNWKPGDFEKWPIEDLGFIIYDNFGTPSGQEYSLIVNVRFPFGDRQRDEFIEVWRKRKHELTHGDFPEPPRRGPVEIILPDYKKKWSGLRQFKPVMTLGERVKFGHPLNENRRRQAYQQKMDLEKQAKKTKNEAELGTLKKKMQQLNQVIDDPVVIEAREVIQHCRDQKEYFDKVEAMYQDILTEKQESLSKPFDRLRYKIKGIYERLHSKPAGYERNRGVSYWPPKIDQDFDRLLELGYDFDIFENAELPEKYKRTPEEERARVARYYGEFYDPYED